MSKLPVSVGDMFVVSPSVKSIKACGGYLVSQLLGSYAGQVMKVTRVEGAWGPESLHFSAVAVDNSELSPIGIPAVWLGQGFFTRVKLGRSF